MMSPQNRTGEQPFYFGPSGKRRFAVLHAPAAEAKAMNAVWVLCPAFAEERNQSQRLMVQWARRLSGQGFWVLRFDYRGYGDSEGLFEQHTVADYLEDLACAIEEAEQRSGVPCRGLCGLRLGASLAAMTAPKLSNPPALILWEPIVSGEAYLDEMLRLTMAKQMAQTSEAPPDRNQLKESLAAGGEIDILGHALRAPLYDSIASLNLADGAPENGGPVRIVAISNVRSERIPRQLQPLLEAYQSVTETEFERIRMPQPWLAAKTEYDVEPEELFEPTLAWIEKHFAGVSDAATPGNAPQVETSGEDRLVTPDWTERIVGFPVNDDWTWGILHEPKNADPKRPVVVLLSTAENCRAADARFHVKLAQQIGQLGWTSLRVDPRSVGDSQGSFGEMPLAIPRLYHMIQTGFFLPDTRAALDFLECEIGAHSFVLAGICGGAVTSVLLAAEDTRIAGIAPLELTLLYSIQPGLAKASYRFRQRVRDALLSHHTPGLKQAKALWFTARRLYGRLTSPLAGTQPHRRELQPLVDQLGPRANVQVLSGLLQCAGRRLPIAAIFGDTAGAQAFAGIEEGVLEAYGPSADRLTYHVVEKADHLFTEPAHTQEVFDHLCGWLTRLHEMQS